MAYQALYRTYRPAQFCDVVGQDHITKVLSGQIAMLKISHAYLFAGPRGTGKTSLAKIFSTAVNCTDRNGFEACGKCDACKNGSVDIIEIDAASNNGVDNIREIRDRANLLPALCRYKVYIVDEAHMLSKGAFNALLKTLEEPPLHVIFILATTEPHKLPPTIRSRCQRYDFKRLSVDVLVSLLKSVSKAESIEYDDEALLTIARAAEGGARDALSILDQCLAFGKVTAKAVAASLGGTDIAKVLELTGYISNYEERKALETLREIIDSGSDTRALIGDLAEMFRRMVWISSGVKEDGFAELEDYAEAYGKSACVRALNILIGKEFEMRQNLRADIILETAVMMLMAPEDDVQCGYTERIEKLEQKLNQLEKQGIKTAQAPAEKQQNKPAVPKKQEAPPPQETKEKVPAAETTGTVKSKPSVEKADGHWSKVLESLRSEERHIFHSAKHVLETKIVGNTFELILDEENDVSESFLKGQAVLDAVLSRITQHVPEIKQVGVIVKSKPKDPENLNVFDMFGGDIEQV